MCDLLASGGLMELTKMRSRGGPRLSDRARERISG
jgi:hypothetical protein